ncbi:hypothetical protein AOLI_G00128690 [Acnodon oligacanthus]
MPIYNRAQQKLRAVNTGGVFSPPVFGQCVAWHSADWLALSRPPALGLDESEPALTPGLVNVFPRPAPQTEVSSAVIGLIGLALEAGLAGKQILLSAQWRSYCSQEGVRPGRQDSFVSGILFKHGSPFPLSCFINHPAAHLEEDLSLQVRFLQAIISGSA